MCHQQLASRASQLAPPNSQYLDAMKELAYGASHEINNPLANIAARAQTLLRDEENDQRRRALQAIHRQAMRAHEMISDLMLFARPSVLAIEKLDLCELIRSLVAELAEECNHRETQLLCHFPEGQLFCHADAEQLAVAVKALCTNALEAIGMGGQVDISVRLETTSEISHEKVPDCDVPDYVVHEEGAQENFLIEVADNGPGISDEVRRHMFDPFYSGREAGRGLGFGLSKCWRIVTEHGGTIVAANQREQGALFTIRLPAEGISHGQS